MKKITSVLIIVFTSSIFCQNQSNDKQLKTIALSFYNWYINAINTDGIPFDFTISNKNGMCELDSTGYFKELRKLGTISEKFLCSELERVKGCSKFLTKVTWEEYRKIDDAYAYHEDCPFLSYFYWIHSQEPLDGVEIKSINVKNNNAEAELKFYSSSEKERFYWSDLYAIVSMEKEKNSWKIVSIQIN